MLKKAIQNLLTQRQEDRRAQLYRNFMRHEAKIGGTLFGPIPDGRRREFFCMDNRTWFWYEEWTDSNGQQQVVHTRYDVRPDGIVKSQNGGNYRWVAPHEARRLFEAAKLYAQRTRKEIYSFI